MRIILAIVVISCFFAVATSQSDCDTRRENLNSCLSRLASAAVQGQTTDFCNECGNSLVAYEQNCEGGAGVAAVQRVCPNATGGSPTIHTVTAFITALALTGVAVLFY